MKKDFDSQFEERKKLLESFLEPLPQDLPEGFPTAAEMIREDRERRGLPHDFFGPSM